MGPTNIVAHELESHGVRTFSAKEFKLAFNILGLMHPLLFSITQVELIWADLNGGMDRLPDLADVTSRIHSKLNKKADLRRAIARDNNADFKIKMESRPSASSRLSMCFRQSISASSFLPSKPRVLCKIWLI